MTPTAAAPSSSAVSPLMALMKLDLPTPELPITATLIGIPTFRSDWRWRDSKSVNK